MYGEIKDTLGTVSERWEAYYRGHFRNPRKDFTHKYEQFAREALTCLIYLEAGKGNEKWGKVHPTTENIAGRINSGERGVADVRYEFKIKPEAMKKIIAKYEDFLAEHEDYQDEKKKKTQREEAKRKEKLYTRA